MVNLDKAYQSLSKLVNSYQNLSKPFENTVLSAKPKTIHLLFRTINRDSFEAVSSGRKKIETRAATPKYMRIRIGDTVRLVCGKESFTKKVISTEHFNSIRALLDKYPPNWVNPKYKTEAEIRRAYYSFPRYREKIAEFGLVAFKLK